MSSKKLLVIILGLVTLQSLFVGVATIIFPTNLTIMSNAGG